MLVIQEWQIISAKKSVSYGSADPCLSHIKWMTQREKKGRETQLLGEGYDGQIETTNDHLKGSLYISDPLEYGFVSGKRKINVYGIS